jgi:3-dehydroquinate synthase
MRRVTVALAERSYDVVIAPSLAGLAIAGESVVVTDTNVAPLHGHRVADLIGARDVVVLEEGEQHKTCDAWLGCVDRLLMGGFDRSSVVVAVGGGVVSDIAGFAAATAMRGMRFVVVPTTLLAMVDASVGGKTGVNHPAGKNLVGAFYQPELVWVSLDTLASLPVRERVAGLGEVVKTALLSEELFELVERLAPQLRAGEAAALARVVEHCVRIKAGVVQEDEHERGRRAVLNLGHTVAHALEVTLGYGALRHGEAVGLGLVAEAAWAAAHGHGVDPGIPKRIGALLGVLGLPQRCPEADIQALVAAMALDKKIRGDMITLPVPVRPGEVRLVRMPRVHLPHLLDWLP